MSTSSFTFANALLPTTASGSAGPFLIPPLTAGTANYTDPLLIYVIAVCAPNTTTATPGITSTQNEVFTLSFVQSCKKVVVDVD